MNNAQLQGMRGWADLLLGSAPRDWHSWVDPWRDWHSWVGPWESQRMFGITGERAREYARLYGGTATRRCMRWRVSGWHKWAVPARRMVRVVVATTPVEAVAEVERWYGVLDAGRRVVVTRVGDEGGE